MTQIINTNLHPITFEHETWCCGQCQAVGPESGGRMTETYSVEPCGVVISATPVETPAGVGPGGVELVQTQFFASPEAEAQLAALEAAHPGAVIVGSIIAAQAFPGRVLAMVPAPGFERVPPAEKRMCEWKFTTFAPVAVPA